MTLLQINTSLFSNSGQSTRLADQFVAGRQAADRDLDVVVRDLAREPVPHLTAERFQAFLAQPEARTPAQKTIVAESDALIDELKIADVIVIGLPMYNFGVPSQLKAYFDHVARAGVTFRYTDKGPLGLLTGKKAYVFATRGGLYAGTPRDSETSYVRQILAFLGITDVEFVYAEGLAINESSKQASLAKAASSIARLNGIERLAA
jgi:FMN-dependent NADH-azoreductase